MQDLLIAGGIILAGIAILIVMKLAFDWAFDEPRR